MSCVKIVHFLREHIIKLIMEEKNVKIIHMFSLETPHIIFEVNIGKSRANDGGRLSHDL